MLLIETNINHLHYFSDTELQSHTCHTNIIPKYLPKINTIRDKLDQYKQIDDLFKIKAITYYDTL
jgi:hypothetical protein